MQLLFVIGFPRSGTKLLLQLLRTNSQISGPKVEVNLAHQFEKLDFEAFKKALEQSTLWVNMGDVKKKVESFLKEYSVEDEKTWEEFYIQFLESCDLNKGQTYVIDKSPRYITKGEGLLKNFPNAKYIHITRDVRAIANSHANVWKKNVYRVADQWNKSVLSFHRASKGKSQVLVIRYEDLVENPKKCVLKIQNFLELETPFDIDNVSSNESHGSVAATGIVSTAKVSTYKPSVEKRMEEYAFNGLKEFGYSVKFASQQKEMPFISKLRYFLNDQLNVLGFHIKEKGLVKGVDYFIRLKK